MAKRLVRKIFEQILGLPRQARENLFEIFSAGPTGKKCNSIFWVKITSTFFYVGYLPFIPGTFGSLAGIILFYFVKNSISVYASVVLVLAILGFLSAGEAEKVFNRKDPKYVVIDEVVGMLLSLMFLPYDIKLVVIGFLLFRLLDTLKPFPAGWLQHFDGSKGIMGDDIASALYTNIILQIVFRLISVTAS